MRKFLFSVCIFLNVTLSAQVIDTDKVMIIGRNALYFEDFVLAIQYFNQVIKAKPYLAEPYYYRAVSKFLLEDNQGAEDDCTSCIDRNPFISAAYSLRGDARLNLGKYDLAIKDYEKSLSIIPDSKLVLINLGIANIYSKDYDKAETVLDKLISLNPNYVQGILTRGSMFLEKGDTIQAMKDYNLAIEKEPYTAQSYSIRGILYYQLKDYDKALSDFDESIKLDPVVVGNYINRGLVKYNLDDYRGAMTDYDRVVDLDSMNIIGRFNRGLLRAQVGDDNNAIKDFDVVLKLEPDNFIAYFNRSLLKSNIGDYRGAILDIDKVLMEYPDFYQGFYARADLKRQIKDNAGADKDLRYARKEEDRIRREIYAGRDPSVNGEKTREKSDNTIDKFDKLLVADKVEQEKSKYKNTTRGRVQNQQVTLALEPVFMISYYEKNNDIKNTVRFNADIDELNKTGLFLNSLRLSNTEPALTQEEIHKHNQSINYWADMIGKDEKNPILYFGRAIDYILLRNFSEAISDLNKAIIINPEFALAYFTLGTVYAKQLELNDGETQQIINSTNQLQVKDNNQSPKLPSLTNEKEIPEYAQAISNLTKTLEINPQFAYAFFNRAAIKARRQDYRGAILDYNEALRLEKDLPEAYFNRGISRLYLGEKDKGLSDLRKAGELGIINAYGIIKRISNN